MNDFYEAAYTMLSLNTTKAIVIKPAPPKSRVVHAVAVDSIVMAQFNSTSLPAIVDQVDVDGSCMVYSLTTSDLGSTNQLIWYRTETVAPIAPGTNEWNTCYRVYQQLIDHKLRSIG